MNDRLCVHPHAADAALPFSLRSVVGASSCDLATLAGAETDPRPLYYFPWVPDAEFEKNTYNMAEFGNRILGSIARQLGPLRPPIVVCIPFETILGDAYTPFLPSWRDKAAIRHVRTKAFELAGKVIRSVNVKKEDDKVLVNSETTAGGLGVIMVTIPSEKLHRRVIEALARWEAEQWFNPGQMEIEFSPNQSSS